MEYNVALPGSLPVRIATWQRRKMYEDFIALCGVEPSHTILDCGATSDRTLESSNYLEALHPYPDRITACGIEDAAFLEELYSGVRFVRGDALDLPFADQEFDYVHCSAVIEHVGSFANQQTLIKEVARVARRGFFVTTPNRWFPIEFHTLLPVVRWLPKPWGRAIMRKVGLEKFASEDHLNLMTARELRACTENLAKWRTQITSRLLVGLPSNLLLVGGRAES